MAAYLEGDAGCKVFSRRRVGNTNCNLSIPCSSFRWTFFGMSETKIVSSNVPQNAQIIVDGAGWGDRAGRASAEVRFSEEQKSAKIKEMKIASRLSNYFIISVLFERELKTKKNAFCNANSTNTPSRSWEVVKNGNDFSGFYVARNDVSEGENCLASRQNVRSNWFGSDFVFARLPELYFRRARRWKEKKVKTRVELFGWQLVAFRNMRRTFLSRGELLERCQDLVFLSCH